MTALGTTIHELLHKLKQDNPGLYAELLRDLLALAKLPGSKYEALKREAGYSDDEIPEELISDFAANSFNDPKFLKDFATRNPSVFRKVINALLKLIDQIKAKLTRAGQAAGDVFKDLQAARDVLAKALAEWGDWAKNAKEFKASDEFKASNATLTKPGLVDIGGAAVDPFSIEAHHGTPHKVDKFTTAKIGTGEGAQVYGWGLYFAENKAVAQDYAKKLGEPPKPQRITLDGEDYGAVSGGLNSEEEAMIWELDGRQRWYNPDKVDPLSKVEAELAKTVDNFRRVQASVKAGKSLESMGYSGRDMEAFETAQQTYAWLKRNRSRLAIARASQGGGNEYTVTLNADPEDFLDWDKPLSAQPKIAERLAEGRWPKAITGNELYQQVSDDKQYEELYGKRSSNPKAASAYLAHRGIKGIRYADQGSRQFVVEKENSSDPNSAWVVAGINGQIVFKDADRAKAEADLAKRRTYNYVIFNDADIAITHENGQPITTEAAFSLDQDGDLFGPPETVQEQKDRLAKEKRQAEERKAKAAMLEKAGARFEVDKAPELPEDVNVKVEGTDPKTGDIVEREMSARRAGQWLTGKMDMLRRLLDCLEGKAKA